MAIHRKTPVLETLFNKVAGLKAYKFTKNSLQLRCFLVNIVKCLRTFQNKEAYSTPSELLKMFFYKAAC